MLASRLLGSLSVFLLTFLSVIDSGYALDSTIVLDNGQSLQLNGMGEAKQLGAVVFIGGLYLDRKSSEPTEIIDASKPQRMSLRFNNRISATAWKRLWLDYISINTSKDILQPHVNEVQQFLEFFQGAIKVGDQLNIDFMPEKGTLISLNGIYLGTIPNQDFYPILLNTWIGPRPLNDEFQLAILGKDEDSKIQEEFDTLAPTVDRVSQVKRWAIRTKLTLANLDSEDATPNASVTTLNEVSRVDEETKANSTHANDREPQKAIEKTAENNKTAIVNSEISQSLIKPAEKLTNKTIEKSTDPAPSSSKKTAKIVQNTEKTPEKTPEKKDVESSQPKDSSIASQDRLKQDAVTQSKTSPPNDTATKTQLATDKPSTKRTGASSKKPITLNDEEFLAIKEGYEEELTDVILEGKKYPFQKMKRAYQKRSSFQKTNVKVILLLKIAKNGSLLDAKVLSSSGEKILDNEAISLAEKAKNIPPLPNYLNVEFLEVEVIVPYRIR